MHTHPTPVPSLRLGTPPIRSPHDGSDTAAPHTDGLIVCFSCGAVLFPRTVAEHRRACLADPTLYVPPVLLRRFPDPCRCCCDLPPYLPCATSGQVVCPVCGWTEWHLWLEDAPATCPVCTGQEDGDDDPSPPAAPSVLPRTLREAA